MGAFEQIISTKVILTVPNLPVLLPILAVLLLLTFLLLTKASKNILEHLLVWSFISPALVLNIFQISQISASGSSFKSSLIRIASVIFLPAIFILCSHQFPRRNLTPSRGLNLFLSSWFLLFFLALTQVFFLKNTAITFFGVLAFLVLFIIILIYDLDFISLARKTADMGFALAILTLVGYLTKFNFMTSLEAGGGAAPATYDPTGGLAATAVAIAGEATTSIVSRFTPFNSLFGISGRAGGFFTDGGPQEMGPYFGFVIAILLVCKFNKFDYLKFVVIFIVGTTTGSRTFLEVSVVACVVKLLITIGERRNFKNLWRFTIIGSVISFFLIYNLASYVITQSVNTALTQSGLAGAVDNATAQNVQSFSGRLPLWNFIFTRWLDDSTFYQRIFGFGPETLGPIAQAYFNQPAYGHAHNAVLQYLWDYGLMGAVAILIITIGVIYFIVKRKTRVQALILSIAILSLQTEVFFVLNILISPTMIFWWLACIAILDAYSGKSITTSPKNVATSPKLVGA